MDEEVKREFEHVAEKLKQFEQDSRTVIVLDSGFKTLSRDFAKLGKKLDRAFIMVGTVGLGIVGDLLIRLVELHK